MRFSLGPQVAASRVDEQAPSPLGWPPGGFTLIELLIVSAILLILAGFAIRPWGDMAARWAVEGAANEFVSRHELARSVAIRFGRTSRLRIDASTGHSWVEADTSAQFTGTRDTIGTVASLSGDGVQLAASRTTFCFDGRGIPSAAAAGCSTAQARIVFVRGHAADTVVVTALGKVFR